MLTLVKKLNANRNLLKNLIVRDLKHRYVGSIGGFLWSVIHPVVLLISYTFIFTMLGVRTFPGGGTVHFSGGYCRFKIDVRSGIAEKRGAQILSGRLFVRVQFFSGGRLETARMAAS